MKSGEILTAGFQLRTVSTKITLNVGKIFCIGGMVLTYSREWINRGGMVASPVRGQLNRKNEFCPSPFPPEILSRETGSAVPSRVSPFILRTQTAYGAYSRDSSRFPRRRRPFIYIINRIRVSPECIRSRNCVPMAFTAESTLAQGQSP